MEHLAWSHALRRHESIRGRSRVFGEGPSGQFALADQFVIDQHFCTNQLTHIVPNRLADRMTAVGRVLPHIQAACTVSISICARLS